MNFTKCIKERIEEEKGLLKGLYSLILYGSYVRSDFFEGVSDLGFFAVIMGDPGEVVPKLRMILEECTCDVRALLFC